MKKKPVSKVIERAIEAAGSQTELAKRMTAIMGREVRQQHIFNWLIQRSIIPAEYVIPMEKAIEGAVTRHEIRADIYPLEAA
jgi:DNA-binding transcriptional regulator YdaS (Cro superfamily)